MKRNAYPAVRESAGRISLASERVELGFSGRKNGALISIIDKASGCELRPRQEAPALLWKLALRSGADKELDWITSDEAAEFRWHKEEKNGAVTLHLVTSGFKQDGLTVTVKITLSAESPLTYWRMHVAGVGKDAAVYEFICPILSGLTKAGDAAPGESLAIPLLGEGYVFKDPYPVVDNLPLCSGAGPEMAEVGIGEIALQYPGSLSLQMCALYNDRAGLYFAAYDAAQHVKEFAMKPWAGWDERLPILRMSHFPGEVPGQDVEIPYDAVVGVFHGDWYDAADIYKAWATKQWWCRTKLHQRDIAGWMREGIGGVFQMSNYHIPKLEVNHSMGRIADTVNELSKETGVPLIGLVFNWEGGGGWTGPKGFFPPREGEEKFRKAMKRLREAGNYGMVYITGGVWYVKIGYDPPYDSSPEFEAEGARHAVKELDGSTAIRSWYPGWEVASICPKGEYLKQLTLALFLECLDLGVTVVQIDNFPIGRTLPCYDPSHGHPPGYGSWRNEAWNGILSEVRRRAKAKDPDCAITTEAITECFIPWIDMYDQRAGNMEYFGHYSRRLPMGGELIPLFNYVYNEYIGSYYAAYPECNRPEVLYWTRGLGKAVAQGVVPTGGRYLPDPPAHNPVTIAFFKKIARAVKNDLWPYLMFGEMLRPPVIDVPSVTAQYCKFNYIADKDRFEHRSDPAQRHEVKDSAVQHGVFRGRDGSMAYFFANVSNLPVGFDVDVSSYDSEAATFHVEKITDGKREGLPECARLPHRERITMEPFSATIIIVRPES
jgi:hypothetical protein